ncbi:hypothetical protein BDV96DRAFT_605515 [Lophiotrema nucula]|uniref:Mid2 domain-containing protein n=1 Tax=Lophiotrema nucula TaxID=690887 RepID=A0A6A5YMT9_9PLEO|nr:hypothetical protein BDV96DRAFT_605515 [Lophiotrema nucula]
MSNNRRYTERDGVVTGSPQVVTSIPPAEQPISVISDGQPQNTLGLSTTSDLAISQISDGQPQNTQGVVQSTSTTNGQGSTLSSIFGASTSTRSDASSRTGTTLSTSSSSPSSSATLSSQNGSSTPIGAIVGGVLGGRAIIGIIIVAVVYILRRHPRSKIETRNAVLEDQPPRYPGQDMHEMPNSVFVPRELGGREVLELEGDARRK